MGLSLMLSESSRINLRVRPLLENLPSFFSNLTHSKEIISPSMYEAYMSPDVTLMASCEL